jgi:hypothetical protein
MWMEAGTRQEGLRKLIKYLNDDSEHSGRDFNPGPPGYKPRLDRVASSSPSQKLTV